MKPLVYRKTRRVRTQDKPRSVKTLVVKGDSVQVISGDFRGQRGRVLRVLRKKGKVVIEGINVVKRHRAARRGGEESQIIEFPAPLPLSKVMLIDPKSGEPTRVRRKKDKDGTVERISVKSGQSVPKGV